MCSFSLNLIRKNKDLRMTSFVLVLTGKGVITNNLTGYIAGIMFLSLLPFTIMLFGDIISSAVGKSITILVALFVSVTFLLSYFTYQVIKKS